MGLGIFVQRVNTTLAVTRAGTVYSASVSVPRLTGFCSVLLTTTAGSVTVTQQCSLEGTTFYDAVDSDGNALGPVVAAMTVGTKYIQFAPVIAPYIRFKVVEGNVAALSITIDLISQKGLQF